MALTSVQRLKLELMTAGITVKKSARRRLCDREDGPPLTMADYTSASGISMELEDRIWVNAPIKAPRPDSVNSPAYVLDFRDGHYFVRTADSDIKISPVPLPSYFGQVNRWRKRYTSYAHTQTDRVRISPVAGCGATCEYCNSHRQQQCRDKRIRGLLDAVNRAVDDPLVPARHVLITDGRRTAQKQQHDRGIYTAVLQSFPDIDIDILVTRIPGQLDVGQLKELGAHGLAINLEIYNDERAKEVMPDKTRVPRQKLLNYIEKAAEIFGVARIHSTVLLGLEPLEDSLKAVEALAKLGCEPVLVPYRPDQNAPLPTNRLQSVEFLIEAYQRSRDITEKHGMKLGPRCIPCQHNALTFPDSSGWYYASQPRARIREEPGDTSV